MTTTYASFLKKLREEKELSQAEVAKRAGMSRPSYVAVEKGTKELTLAEAAAIANLFGITVDELSRTQIPNVLKYKQMLLAFLREAKESKKVLKKTKLAKLLYLTDFSWYYKHGESMSGLSYRKIAFGPVADAYFRLVEEMEEKGELNIKQVLREDYHMYEIEETRASAGQALDLLSKAELKHIHQVWKKWEDAKTNEIVGFTHKQLPYFLSRDGEVIPYELIKQVDAELVY
jgi:transcriptional regulator with XRE-family HTH domain